MQRLPDAFDVWYTYVYDLDEITGNHKSRIVFSRDEDTLTKYAAIGIVGYEKISRMNAFTDYDGMIYTVGLEPINDSIVDATHIEDRARREAIRKLKNAQMSDDELRMLGLGRWLD